MRIGIDLTCWSNRRGYGRFTRGLVQALLEHDRENEYLLFVDRQTAATAELPEPARRVVMPTHRAPSEAASASGRRSLRDLRVMRSSVGQYFVDVFFFPSVYTYFPVRKTAAVILGIHDVIAEDFPRQVFPQPLRRALWTAKSWLARRQADYLLTVSEHAKKGLLRHFRWPPERIWVVGEAPDPVFQPVAGEAIDQRLLSRFGLAPGDTALVYLGGINPHKNLRKLIDSLAELRSREGLTQLRLIFIGDLQSDNFTPGIAQLRRRISALGLEDAVIFTGFLEDAETRHLLAFARALVLPSLAEGFGLPAVEAAACCTPVVVTRNSPLPELLAGGGLFFDPESQEELTQALRRITTDDGLYERLASRALARARKLDWRRSAEQFLGLLGAIREERG